MSVDPVVLKLREQRGLLTKVAGALGISRAAVSDWKRVPPKHVHRVAKLLNWHPHTIRPDIFPPTNHEAKRSEAKR